MGRSSSYIGLIIASRPLCLPIIPSALSWVPGSMPGTARRPRNTRFNAPESSTMVHSTATAPDHGWTLTDRTRPATTVRWR